VGGDHLVAERLALEAGASLGHDRLGLGDGLGRVADHVGGVVVRRVLLQHRQQRLDLLRSLHRVIEVGLVVPGMGEGL